MRRSHSLWTQGFRFSFTPLPGSFSPFLHSTMRYRSLRVFRLTGWSPLVPPGFLVSRRTLDTALPPAFPLTGLSPSLAGFPKAVLLRLTVSCAVRTPRRTRRGLGSSGSARRYSRNRCFFLFLRLLRCFSSPGSPPYAMDSRMDTRGAPRVGSPIQTPADQRACAPPRSFSQLVASFFGP